MPALFLQLARNTEFWSGSPHFPRRTDVPVEPCSAPVTGPAGARITFPGSQLLYQYYPGQGLQIQPLGNFGRANGLYGLCSAHKPDCDLNALHQLLDELVAIASKRGGFTTWEYWFAFSGASPPWTSGMADATAIQALARGSTLLHEPSYMRVAKSALGVFDRSAPLGVRSAARGGGVHYLLYSFSPGEHVLNAFMQTLNGIYDYALLSGDKHASRLFHDGDRAARREMSGYDTGAWTRYSLNGAEASLNYQEVATSAVGHLCKRSKIAFYCRAAKRFGGYLKKPTRIHYKGARSARAGSRVALGFTIDKVSCITAKVTDASGHGVYRARTKFIRGRHAFTWAPRKPGRYKVRLDVLDLKQNKSSVEAGITVRRK
jgi:hypothetical protein